MRDLSVTALRVLVAVARTGSFSAAAESLGYTQPAVSRQVLGAERAAGTPLFARHARGVRTTAAGEIAVRQASVALDALSALDEELAGLEDRLAGRLAVGGFPTVTASLLPRAIARMRLRHPDLEISLTEASTPTQLTALRRRRLEVAVIATGTGLPAYDLAGLEVTDLDRAPAIGVAVAERHPFAERGHVTPADLHDERWIVGSGAGLGPEFGPWPGIEEPTIAFAAREWTTRLGLVAAELGIALLPALTADAVPRGVRWVPIHDPAGGLGRRIHVATRTDPGHAAAIMRDAVVDEAGRSGVRP